MFMIMQLLLLIVSFMIYLNFVRMVNTFLCVIERVNVFLSALSIICLDRNALYKCNVLLLTTLKLRPKEVLIIMVKSE